MGGGIGDWARLHQQAFEHLKPGGWFEMQEYEAWVGDQDDPDMTRAPNIKKWVDLVVEASIMFGKSVKVAKEQRQFMIDAGFTDVQDDVFTVNAPALELFYRLNTARTATLTKIQGTHRRLAKK